MKNEEQYKTLNFIEMMIEMGTVCEECGDKPSFPDGWYFAVDPKWIGCPMVCPTCMEKNARKEK